MSRVIRRSLFRVLVRSRFAPMILVRVMIVMNMNMMVQGASPGGRVFGKADHQAGRSDSEPRAAMSGDRQRGGDVRHQERCRGHALQSSPQQLPQDLRQCLRPRHHRWYLLTHCSFGTRRIGLDFCDKDCAWLGTATSAGSLSTCASRTGAALELVAPAQHPVLEYPHCRSVRIAMLKGIRIRNTAASCACMLVTCCLEASSCFSISA